MVDDAAHEFGIGSDEYVEALGAVERAAVTFLRGLPEDAVLLLTADHGHMNLDREQIIYSNSIPELKRGVRWVGGDLRAAQVYTKATTTEDAFERWQKFFGNTRWVVRREELIARGWFGSKVTDEVRGRIGNFLVIDRDRGGVAQVPEKHGKQQVSTHAAWTQDEILIPNVVLHP
jgi:predicted AlkP superfamily pyrophosphatase or phosphodiesterase